MFVVMLESQIESRKNEAMEKVKSRGYVRMSGFKYFNVSLHKFIELHVLKAFLNTVVNS